MFGEQLHLGLLTLLGKQVQKEEETNLREKVCVAKGISHSGSIAK